MKQNKTLRIVLIVGALLVVFAMGAGAVVGVQQIAASLRPDISVELDGQAQTLYDQNGARVYPISYNGTTYLPIRAIGTLLEQEVVWDSQTKTVSLARRTETPAASLTYDAVLLRIKTQEGRYTTLLSDVNETAKAATYAENLTIFNRLDGRRATALADVRTLQVDVSEAARLGRLTESQRADFVLRLSNLDANLTGLRATLTAKYAVDTATGTAAALRSQIVQLQSNLKALEPLVLATEQAASYSAWKSADDAARGSCKTLRDSLYALQLALNDSLRRSAITYAEYSAMVVDTDQLDTASRTLRDRMDTASAKWSGATKPDSGSGNQDSQYYTTQIAALQSEADGLLVKCRDYFTNKNRDWNAGTNLYSQVNSLENRIDALEHTIEASTKLSRDTRWSLLRQLDKVDNTADKASDFLEKAGLDDDYYEYDDDHYDDDRYDHDWDDDRYDYDD